jgi:hypothetical protein
MTHLLEKAISKISNLSENEQDYIARLILDEIESEKKWTSSFKSSQDELTKLGEESKKEYL